MAGFRIVRPDTAFAAGAPKGKRRPRETLREHTKFVRSLPCCICGSRRQVEAAHVRSPSAAHGKSESGTGAKPSDEWTVPLCRAHHQDASDAQHEVGERKFWAMHGLDPFTLALSLWCATGDEDRGEAIAAEARIRAQAALPLTKEVP